MKDFRAAMSDLRIVPSTSPSSTIQKLIAPRHESFDRTSSVWPVWITFKDSGASFLNHVVLPMFCGPLNVSTPWAAMPSGSNAAAMAWISHLRTSISFSPWSICPPQSTVL